MKKDKKRYSTSDKKNFFRIIFLFSFLGLLGGRLPALYPAKPVDHYLLDQWKITDGLPSENIRSIAQTSDGYLWLGVLSETGLIRFDGLRFLPVLSTEIKKIKNIYVDTLLADRNDILWLGSEEGLIKYEYKKNKFEMIPLTDSTPAADITCIYEDMNGDLLIGTNRCLYSLKDGKLEMADSSSGVETGSIYRMLEDSRGNLWIGTLRKGLFRFQQKTFIKQNINGLSEDYFPLSIFEDRQGVLWIGTEKGLVRIKDKTVSFFTTRHGLSNDFITSIIEDHDGSLWVGTLNGINRIKKDLPEQVVIEKHLENNLITALFEDRERSLWITTNGSGLLRLRDSNIKTYTTADGLNNDFIFSLYEDRKGRIWAGSCAGLNLFEDGRFIDYPPGGIKASMGTDITVSAITEDLKGNLWLGTLSKGLLRISGKKPAAYTEKGGAVRNYIVALYRDSKDRIWAGMGEGMRIYRQGNPISPTIPVDLQDTAFVGIHEDNNQNIRVSTYDGLLFFERGKFAEKNIKTYFRGTSFTTMADDGTYLWVGTFADGLKRISIKDNSVFSYRVRDGLSSNSIFQILEDEDNRFWLGSDTGIIRVSKKELLEYAEGKTGRINCVLYGVSDGMKSTACIYSALRSRGGEFWFATKKGISVFDPGKMKINRVPPPVIIETVVFNGRPIPKNREDTVFYGISELEFRYTATTFIATDKIKFETKLEGFNRDWELRGPGRERISRYTDVAPGRYTFRVRACNSDGIRNKKGDSFSFTLKAYFYQGILFKTLVLLSILLVGIALFVFIKKYRHICKLKNKYRASTLDPRESEQYMRKLLYLVETEKIYKDESISLQSLSEKIGISARNLSQVINEKLGRNYSHFINSYRVKDAEELLLSPGGKDRSVLSIAYEVGFNSKVVFNRAFKKFTGLTPTQYKKRKPGV